MLLGIQPNQLISPFILTAAVVLLFIEWVHRDLTVTLKVSVWHNWMISLAGLDLAQEPSWHFVRSHLV